MYRYLHEEYYATHGRAAAADIPSQVVLVCTEGTRKGNGSRDLSVMPHFFCTEGAFVDALRRLHQILIVEPELFELCAAANWRFFPGGYR